MDIQGKLDFLKKPILMQYFSEIFGMGYDSKKEKTLIKILILSSIFLSFASGFTTYLGLTEYVHTIIAIFVTTGIQGLLFTSSWRIGVVIVNNFKFSLLLIFLITMFISVFFSYSALLNNLFSPDARKRVQLDRASVYTSNVINELNADLEQELRDKNNSLTSHINTWSIKFNSLIKKQTQPKRIKIAQYEAEYKNYKNKYEREVKLGGTITDQKKITKPGRGKEALKYEEKFNQVYLYDYQPLKNEISIIDVLSNNHNKFISVLLANDFITKDSFQRFKQNYDKLISLIFDETIQLSEIVIPEKIMYSIKRIIAIEEYMKWFKENISIQNETSIQNLKILAMKTVNNMPLKSSESKTNALNRFSKVGLYDGDKVHYFLLSINELYNFNILALGSLFIALSIDCLILFCGLLAARPESFLDMTNADDLSEVKELALEVIFDLDLSDIDSYQSTFIKNIAKLIKLGKADMKFAYDGWPILIKNTVIEENNLAKEVGTLISLGLADIIKETEDKNVYFIGIKTRLILWVSEQIVNFKGKSKSIQNFKKSLQL